MVYLLDRMIFECHTVNIIDNAATIATEYNSLGSFWLKRNGKKEVESNGKNAVLI